MEQSSAVTARTLDPGFERFVERASDGLLRTAFLLCGDRGHAEDLLQSALWRTFQHWSEISEAPDGYVHRVVVNLARDHQRMLRRRVREVGFGHLRPEPIGVDAVQAAGGGELTAAITRLPRRLREVIVLRFVLDLSVAETAAALGTSQGTVKAYTARGLTRLRKGLPEVRTDNRQSEESRDEI